ncbi:MAG: TRAP transporter fused permease subunit [Natronomonas sp.]
MSSGDRAVADEETRAADPEELLEEIERRRSLRGPAVVAVALVGIAFSLFQLWIAARGFVFEATIPGVGTYRVAALAQLQIRAIHVTFALVLAFLLFPTTTGDGAIARRLGYLPVVVRERLGEGPITRATERIRDGVRWLVVDPNRDRVAPVDVVLIGLSLLPTLYYVTRMDEIRNVIRVRGLRGAGTLGEVYPTLEPLAVGPLATRPLAFVLGVLAIVLVLEATRRALGLLLTGLVALFILYGRYGFLIPRDAPAVGILSIRELRWDQVVQNLWYTVEGILGVPVGVSVRFIYIFILFGAFLEMSGAGKWFIDLAYSMTGTQQGGPAKASVVSSGFMGMLSGSSVANTVTTGALTIPLMKRSGYSPEFSGAVESSVSSGGQILPPVMGAAAFLIVEFTATPFREVIIAATLPALAFFFGMWVMVHFEAGKHNIGGLDRSELLDIGPHLKRGWFYLVPLFLLLYYIVIARLSIGRAGWFTIVATVALMAVVAAYNRSTGPYLVGAIAALFVGTATSFWLTGTTPVGVVIDGAGAGMSPTAAVAAAVPYLGVILIGVSAIALLADPRGDAPLLEFDDTVTGATEYVDDRLGRTVATTRAGSFVSFVFKSMDNGARTATVVVIAVAAAGVIPGIINLTGLGGSLRSLILSVSAGSLVLLLILTGIAAVVVGMGMPTTVMYIILVVLLGPTIQEFGIALLAAHLFVLYLGLMADVTPPVAVAAFAAAGIAKSDAFETGKQAFLLSLNKILVPFAFVFAPGIMLLRGGDTAGETTIVGFADIADLGFFVPEVFVPVVAMFAGVYALGVAIIGYRTTLVSGGERIGYTVAALLLSIPGMLLMPAETALAAVGIEAVLFTTLNDVGVRIVGGILLVALLFADRRRRLTATVEDGVTEETEPPVADPGADAEKP